VARPSKNNAAGAAAEQINAVPGASGMPPEGSKTPSTGSENGSQAGLRVEYRCVHRSELAISSDQAWPAILERR
jgi:hypothetical protein